jgi:PAS domain S-box-containing protein
MRRVSSEELRELLKEQGYAYLDVRTAPEFDTGHVAGAFNVPWQLPGTDAALANHHFIEEVCSVLARGHGIVVGCASGVRSLAAAEALVDQGFVRVVEARAGLEGLRDPFGRVKEPGLRALSQPLVTRALPGRSHADIQALRNQLLEAEPISTRDERRMLWKILEPVPVSISFYCGEELVVERASPIVKRSVGRPVEGLPYREAFPNMAKLQFVKEMERVLQTGQAHVAGDTLLETLGTDGQVQRRYWRYGYFPVAGAAGKALGVISCHVDVTQAAESRQSLEAITRRYHSLIEATTQAVWTTTPEGEPVEDTPSWRAITGQTLDVWRNGGWLDAVHPEDRARVLRTWRESVANARLHECEYRLRQADGTYIWSLARAVPVRDSQGKIVEWVGTNIDITARKAAEEARAKVEAERAASFGRELKLREQAEGANRAKDEFLAMLGHELRNPLAPIVTALELMQLEPTRDHVHERGIIARQVRHLGRLVDDLLDVSRIMRGRVDLRRERVSLFDAVQRAVEMASPLLEERRHYLALDVPKDGAYVYGDPARLAQVVANLLMNAAKYSESRGTVSVRARLVGEQVELCVADAGIGIAPGRLSSIFQPFVQESQSLARSHGGLGLGLAIVQSLVEQHGGSVEARSEGLGKGSEFIILLPVMRGGAEHEVAAPDEPATALFTTACPCRVMVVDDNEDAACLLAAWLTRHGYITQVAYDGFSAINLAREFLPDFALLDLGLPVLDGFELAERLLREPTLQQVKLVAVTGYGQEQDRERSRRSGFFAHLVKPVNLQELGALLKQSC